jgi:hypothetical protein
LLWLVEDMMCPMLFAAVMLNFRFALSCTVKGMCWDGNGSE